jgi:hypothetical protein
MQKKMLSEKKNQTTFKSRLVFSFAKGIVWLQRQASGRTE